MAKTNRKSIKNYTTTISVEKTVGEIEGLLARYGARRILKDFDKNGISSLSFMVEVDGKFVPIKLPVNADKIVEILNKQVSIGSIPRRYKDDVSQARRIMWRVLLDWIDAQMTLVELGQRQLVEVFMADVLDMKTNETLYQKMLKEGITGYMLEFKS